MECGKEGEGVLGRWIGRYRSVGLIGECTYGRGWMDLVVGWRRMLFALKRQRKGYPGKTQVD